MSKNDDAWNTLFAQYDILHEIQRVGVYEIDAATIRTVREPRLMSKFDHKANLPKIFQDHQLAILPITRSRYVIGPFEAYHDLSQLPLTDEPVRIPFPAYIESIDPTDLYSEPAVLHCAYVSGMIEKVLGETLWPTISGRMSSGDFDFLIRNRDFRDQSVAISKSQVEIDAGYESQSRIMLVEAKNEAIDDFLIRQLYYPYRLWTDKVSKPVVPVFLTFSNDIFRFLVFAFEDPQRYNSLKLVEQKRYVLDHAPIGRDDIVSVLETGKILPEPAVPFPQADVFPRVVDLLGILMQKGRTKDEITLNYAFDQRQTHYYTRAGMYLGFIDTFRDPDGTVIFQLSRKGRNIMGNPFKAKYLRLVASILEHEVFHRVLHEYL